MPNMTSNLVATITAVDVDTNQPVTRGIGSPSYAGKTGEYMGFKELAVAATPYAQALPVALVLCCWIRNRGGAGNLKVEWTPQGGASAVVTYLEPGASLLFWNPTTSVTAGITALTLTPSVNNLPFEAYYGG